MENGKDKDDKALEMIRRFQGMSGKAIEPKKEIKKEPEPEQKSKEEEVKMASIDALLSPLNDPSPKTVSLGIKYPAPKQEAKPKLASTDVKSIKELKENTQKAIENVKNSVDKAQIEKLLNASDAQKQKSLKVDIGGRVDKLSKEQEVELVKKMEEWKVPKDVSEANAAVVISWIKDV